MSQPLDSRSDPIPTPANSAVDARRTAAPRGAKRWLFRLGAVLLGLAVLPALELICWCGGWGEPTQFDDPFVGFSEIHPLFEADAERSEYHVCPSRLRFFAPESFAVEKPARTFRIFCLGGSTVQGRPYAPETSFTTFLEMALNAADPRYDWEVINCGGISYASYRLVPIMEECLRYQPDLFVVCTGQNEFLEDRTYAHLKDPSAPLWASQHVAGRLRTFVLLREAMLQLTEDPQSDPTSDMAKPLLGPEADPILDYHDSLKAYTRDDAWRSAIVAHFEFNLRRMVSLAQANQVPLVLMLPPSNLADTPPLKAEHQAGLTLAETSQWEDLIATAQGSYRQDRQAALRLLKQALEIDNQHAGLWYELGKCYQLFGLHAQAREAYVQARDQDICPLRMISPLETAMRRVASDQGVSVLDAHALLEAECETGILGSAQLIDHVHPTIAGHQKLGLAMVDWLAELGHAQPTGEWRAVAERDYATHVAGLDSLYFLKGARTLESVRGWTQGEADGPAAVGRFPHLLPEPTP